MQSYDRVLRKSAFDSLYSVYGQFRNTSAATLSAQLKQLLFFANVRKYPSTLDAALDGNEVPTEIYRNLIDAVHRSFAPMYRYVALRKKLLGVDELHMYDLYVPVVDGVEMKFTFEEAKEIALKALAPLGEDYLNLLREGFANGWIDVYENEGKRSGAYSAGRAYTRMCCSTSRARSTMCSRLCMRWATLSTRTCPTRPSRPRIRITLSLLPRLHPPATRPC